MAASSAERLPPRALTLELRQRSHDRRSSPLRPRSGPLVDTRNQQTPVSELLCRLGASVADGGWLCPGGSLIEHLTAPHHRDRLQTSPSSAACASHYPITSGGSVARATA
mmetsp:Transcript_43825/g.145072  ORF Transcript_43825/g.145072 Transcript_43825/m.145072 type:complete len:110 (+) Transcript_43825:231-560(+)